MPGVPFTVKGNIDLVGTPTIQGLKARQVAYRRLHAPVGERLRGGSDPDRPHELPSWRDSLSRRQRTLGATVNPWDRSRPPGASSGGEAAALAT